MAAMWGDGQNPAAASSGDFTRLLHRASAGNRAAAGELFSQVYAQLRKIAQQRMSQERPGHTLQATALVHEAYLRLLGGQKMPWRGRAKFFAAAAEAMRRILVEHARARGRIKRGGAAETHLPRGAAQAEGLSNPLWDWSPTGPRWILADQFGRSEKGLTLGQALLLSSATFSARRHGAGATPTHAGTQSPDLMPPLPTTYERNELNQYYRADTDRPTGSDIGQGYRFDADGNLIEAYVAADMNCDGVVNAFDIDAFTLALTDPVAYYAQYPNCNHLNGDMNGDGVLNAFDVDLFSEYLTDHDGATGLRYTYAWDAENRLVSFGLPAALTPTNGAKRASYAYDYLGRRVWKQVETYQSGNWNVTEQRKFVWSGCLLLLELDGKQQRDS